MLFVQFDREWSNIARTQERLYAALPVEKGIWNCPSSHYLDTWHLGPLVVADARPTRHLAARLLSFQEVVAGPSVDRQNVAIASETVEPASIFNDENIRVQTLSCP